MVLRLEREREREMLANKLNGEKPVVNMFRYSARGPEDGSRQYFSKLDLEFNSRSWRATASV